MTDPTDEQLPDNVREEMERQAQDAAVVAFARQAAESTAQVPLATVQATMDRLDARLGEQVAKANGDRPADHEQLAQDVRRVRALLRYRVALEGMAQ